MSRPILLAPLVAILLTTLGCATATRSALDADVDRLCAVDGGIKVYEVATLPAARFDKYGNVKLPTKTALTPEDEYYVEWNVYYYRKGNPEMWRSEHKVVRVRDGNVMGTLVRYTRRGGDMPSPMHESSYTCPAIGSTPGLERAVFRKSNAQ